MHLEHQQDSVIGGFIEDHFQHMCHKLHRREVVIEENHFVLPWFFNKDAFSGFGTGAGTVLKGNNIYFLSAKSMPNDILS